MFESRISVLFLQPVPKDRPLPVIPEEKSLPAEHLPQISYPPQAASLRVDSDFRGAVLKLNRERFG